MVHKVWDKDTSDSEVGSIRDHLVRSYKAIFMEPPPSNLPKEQLIANNLIQYILNFPNISLTLTMSLAELTSLEQLISIMVSQNDFDYAVLNVLWAIFGNLIFKD
jgi:condensin complex subunit 1